VSGLVGLAWDNPEWDSFARSAAACAGRDALASLVSSSRKVSGAPDTHTFDQAVIAV